MAKSFWKTVIPQNDKRFYSNYIIYIVKIYFYLNKKFSINILKQITQCLLILHEKKITLCFLSYIESML
jgi:hypothetical protein